MKLKNIFLTILGVVAFVSCDNIADDNRYLDADIEPTDRVVLLTEFTGMNCVNCPEAAAIATSLLENFPENVIVVAMHPKGHGFVPEGENITPNLARQEAMDYLKEMGGTGSTGLPTGVIDFSLFNKNYLIDRSEWMARAMQHLTVEPKCNIELTHSQTDARNHTIAVNILPKEGATINASLVMWLVESGMVGSQNTHEGIVRDYVHNHALRECLNGLWGDALGVVTAKAVEKSYSVVVNEEYVPENCAVVAVVVDTDTHEVLQAAEVALGTGNH